MWGQPTDETLRATRSKSGVVCAMIVSFLADIATACSCRTSRWCPLWTRLLVSLSSSLGTVNQSTSSTDWVETAHEHGMEDATAVGKF